LVLAFESRGGGPSLGRDDIGGLRGGGGGGGAVWFDRLCAKVTNGTKAELSMTARAGRLGKGVWLRRGKEVAFQSAVAAKKLCIGHLAAFRPRSHSGGGGLESVNVEGATPVAPC